MAGFIKIHRKLLDWEWYDDSAVKAVFLHLLLTANFKPAQYHGRQVERGQAVFGREALASSLGLTVQQTRTALNKLKSTGEISIQPYNKFSVATIHNFDMYQSDADAEQPTNNHQSTINQPSNNHQTTNKQPTNNQQITTSEERKKERKEEIKESVSVDYGAIVDLFNSICVSLPKVTKLTDVRRRAIRSAIQQDVNFDILFHMVEASDFLTNRSGKFSGCGFDWILKPANMVKILEGNYANKPIHGKSSMYSTEGASFDADDYKSKELFNG